ncbi:MAG: hypothetical protein COA86_12315 [Kangiella sp.]|nr:MAG: hypothetical protein COA86_12315 [Kangiella sp.]
MIIIYLHGFRSTGNSGKTQTLRTMFPNHKVIGCDYAPHSPLVAEQQLRELIAKEIESESKSREGHESVIVIGTSLGGFWARWMAKEFGVKALIINPSLHPDSTLPTGEFEIYDESHSLIKVTSDDLESFKQYKVASGDARALKCEVWVAINDELLDADAIVEELEDIHNLKTFESGGHRFSQFGEMKPQIGRFIIS